MICKLGAIGALVLIAGPLGAQTAAGLPTAMDAGWQGDQTCERLFANDDIRVGRCSFPPGVGHERHWHPPHWGFVLSGSTLRVTDVDGTEDRVTETGNSWWSDGIAWHEALNVGETTAVYLIIEPVRESE